MNDTLLAVGKGGGAAALLWGGFQIWKQMSQTHLHPSLLQHTVCMSEPAVAHLLSSVVECLHEKDVEPLLWVVDEAIRVGSSGGREGVSHMARLNGEIVHRLNSLQRERQRECLNKGDDRMLSAVLSLKEEEIPQLEELLDNLLHNRLLDGSST